MATDQPTGRNGPTERVVYTTRDPADSRPDAAPGAVGGPGTDRGPGGNGAVPRPEGPTFTGNRSIGQLTSQLIDNITLLVEKQIELAKQELHETIQSGIGVLKMFGPALAVALLFIIALIHFLIEGLGAILYLLFNRDLRLVSALFFTLLFAIIAGILAYIGYRRLMKMLENPMGNTLESLQEDVEWAQRQLTPDER